MVKGHICLMMISSSILLSVVSSRAFFSANPGCNVLPGSAEQAQPGQILEADSKGFHIACGTGVLAVLECQPEGKRAMAAQSFVNGQQIAVGEILS